MTYKDLFDAQHEYCTTEAYPVNATRQHAFIAGVKWAIKRLSAIPADKVVDEVAELCEVIKQEEELTKWNLKKMRSVPNKCESCDRFAECYTRSGRMREFCKVYSENVVFKRKEQCSKLAK